MKKRSDIFTSAALQEALDSYVTDLAAALPTKKELSDITFSDSFEDRMAKLTHRQKKVYYYWTNTAFKKAVCILAALMLVTALITVGVGAFRSPHRYLPATCTAPQQCTHCDKTAGEPLGHLLIPATCTAPTHCSVCGEILGEMLPHAYADATCSAPRTCTECGATEGEPLPHTFETVGRVEPSCTKEGSLTEKCTVCGEERVTTLAKEKHIPIVGHNCLESTKCGICGIVVSQQKGNHWYAGIDGRCSYCGKAGPNYRPPRDNSPALPGWGNNGLMQNQDPSPPAMAWDSTPTAQHHGPQQSTAIPQNPRPEDFAIQR